MTKPTFRSRAVVLFGTLILALGLSNPPARGQLLAAVGDRCVGNWNNDPRNPTAIQFTRLGDGTADVVYTFVRTFGGSPEETIYRNRPIDGAGVLTVYSGEVTANNRRVQRRITMTPSGSGLLSGRIEEFRGDSWVTTLQASLVCPTRPATAGDAPAIAQAPAVATPPAAPAAAAAAPAPGQAAQPSACPESALSIDNPLECLCTAAAAVEPRNVWGTDIYTNDSSICVAARHAGAIGPDGGVVRMMPRAGEQAYRGSARNGVTTQDYGPWGRAFTVARADGAAPPQSAAAQATPQPAGTLQPPAAATQGVAAQACPQTAQSVQQPLECLCTAAALQGRRPVWGTDIYTSDSHLCLAARHAGVIGEAGGALRVMPLPGAQAYVGSARNGVTSSNFGAYRQSFGVARADTGGKAPADASVASPSQASAANVGDRAICSAPGISPQSHRDRIAACTRVIDSGATGEELRNAHIYRGIGARLLGQRDDALRDYTRAIELDPNFAPPYYNRGLVRSDLGHSSALGDYTRAIELDPDYALAYMARGIHLRNVERPQEALADFDRLLQLQPDSGPALNQRGLTYAALNRHQEALADYDRAIAIANRTTAVNDPSIAAANAIPHYNRGNVLAYLGRIDEALQSYDRAIELAPNQPLAHVSRAFVLAERGRRDEALRGFTRALDLFPGNAEGYYGRALVLVDLSRREEAIPDFDRALQIRPNSQQGLTARAFNYIALGRRDPAIADLDRAVELGRGAPAPLVGRAAGYVQLGERDAAVADYERAAAFTASDATTHNLRCFALSVIGRAEEAMPSCDQAVRLAPNDADPRRTRGYALLRLGRLDAALADYDSAIAMAPNSGTGLYGRAMVRMRRGDQPGAAADLAEAQRLDPHVRRRPAWIWLDYDPRSGAPAPIPAAATPSPAPVAPAAPPAK